LAKNRSVFSRLSLVIDVADDWCEPNTLVLRHPAKHDPKRSRIVMHETLHWWQQLGQGFMTFFAAEDWQRLKEFETNGIISSFGYYTNEFYYEYPHLGFNAFTLNEALTRFWDIHICGPIELLEMEQSSQNEKNSGFWETFNQLKESKILFGPGGTGYSEKAYTLAMEGAGGRYAKPYKMVIDQVGPAIAGIIFPIAAHFAFQTTKPVHYYNIFLDLLIKRIFDVIRDNPNQPIELFWLNMYFKGLSVISKKLLEESQRLLIPIVDIHNSSLKSHPGYISILNDMEYYTTKQLPNTELGKICENYLKNIKSNLDEEKISSITSLITLDLLLATPGVSKNRGILFQIFPPPIVRFKDDRFWLLGYTHRSELHPHWSDEERMLSKWKEDAKIAVDIDNRWNKFLIAELKSL